MPDLLLKDVVKISQLNRRKARYVLDAMSKLNIRASTGQGEHRRFSIDESIRLSICTQLVMMGLKMVTAEYLTIHCEERWRKIADDYAKSQFLFDSSVRDNWFVRIVNTKYIQVQRARPLGSEIDRFDDEYYNIESRHFERWGDFEEHLPVIQWDVTFLAQLIKKKSSE